MGFVSIPGPLGNSDYRRGVFPALRVAQVGPIDDSRLWRACLQQQQQQQQQLLLLLLLSLFSDYRKKIPLDLADLWQKKSDSQFAIDEGDMAAR